MFLGELLPTTPLPTKLSVACNYVHRVLFLVLFAVQRMIHAGRARPYMFLSQSLSSLKAYDSCSRASLGGVHSDSQLESHIPNTFPPLFMMPIAGLGRFESIIISLGLFSQHSATL